MEKCLKRKRDDDSDKESNLKLLSLISENSETLFKTNLKITKLSFFTFKEIIINGNKYLYLEEILEENLVPKKKYFTMILEKYIYNKLLGADKKKYNYKFLIPRGKFDEKDISKYCQYKKYCKIKDTFISGYRTGNISEISKDLIESIPKEDLQKDQNPIFKSESQTIGEKYISETNINKHKLVTSESTEKKIITEGDIEKFKEYRDKKFSDVLLSDKKEQNVSNQIPIAYDKLQDFSSRHVWVIYKLKLEYGGLFF